MKIQISLLAFLLSTLILPFSALAQKPLALSNTESLVTPGRQMLVYEDTSGKLDLTTILNPEYQSAFKPSKEAIPNLGANHSALWCKLLLQNKSGGDWFIRIDNAYIDTVQVFYRQGHSYRKIETGRDFSFEARDFKSINFIFPLALPKDSVIPVYIRAKHYILHLPVQIGQMKPILESEGNYNFFFGIFFGIVGIILLANFIMFFSIRDISLIYYICYTAGFALYTLVQKGYVNQYFSDSRAWLNPYSPLVFYACGIFVPLFAISFLKARELAPLFYKLCITLLIYCVGIILIYLTGRHALASKLFVIDSVIMTPVQLIFGIMIYKAGYKPARFFAIAYSFSLLSFLAFGLQTSAIISSNFFTQNSLQLGILWEIIFFTIAIGDKANILRKEKELAKQEAYHAALENKSLLENQNIMLEQKVKARTHELEVTNQELEAFSYSVSHDLRAPVRRIESLSGMLGEDYAGVMDEGGKDLLKRISDSSVLMNQLIEDMLKLSKITRQTVSKAPCDLSRMAKEICENLAQANPRQKTSWNVGEGMVVNADAPLLRIALQNLLDNAWKYSSKTPEPEVIVGSEIHEGTTRFFIHDNGAGFDMTQAGKLFTPFQRLHTDEEFHGTGIGLATVKRIIVKHGGDISVQSEPGKGTRFTFFL